MRAKIYEYSNDGVISFKENAIYGGSGWELEVELPDFLNPYEAVTGDTVLEPKDSFPQFLSECLRENKGTPCVCVTFGKNTPNTRFYNLKVISKKEADLALYL